MLVGDCVIGTKTKLLDGASSSDREEMPLQIKGLLLYNKDPAFFH